MEVREFEQAAWVGEDYFLLEYGLVPVAAGWATMGVLE